MGFSVNERMMLEKKKEEISKITSEIFDIYQDKNNLNEVMKKIDQILNSLSIIATFSTNKQWFEKFKTKINTIQDFDGTDDTEFLVQNEIQELCHMANSLTFDFIEERSKINNLHVDITLIVNLPLFQANFGH